MQIADLPLEVTDWSTLDGERHPGDTGYAVHKTRTFGNLRVRMVEYTPGYSADHWCAKGHVLYCIAGEIALRIADGRTVLVQKGMSLELGDDASPHRFSSEIGALLFIVD